MPGGLFPLFLRSIRNSADRTAGFSPCFYVVFATGGIAGRAFACVFTWYSYNSGLPVKLFPVFSRGIRSRLDRTAGFSLCFYVVFATGGIAGRAFPCVFTWYSYDSGLPVKPFPLFSRGIRSRLDRVGPTWIRPGSKTPCFHVIFFGRFLLCFYVQSAP